MKKLLLLLLLAAWIVEPIQAQKKELQFQQLFDDTFSPNGIHNVNWMRDGQYYTSLKRVKGDIEVRKYDILSGDYEVLVTSSDLQVPGRERPIIIQDYQFSADESKLLIKTDMEQIWRRSTREHYFVYNFKTEETKKLSASTQKKQYAQLAPTGGKAAYVQDNDLYWVDLSTGKETPVTTDGEYNKIINGASDWVYEEEFGFAKAWYWSPDGQKIAFYRFDESEVREYFLTDWGDLYPGLTRFKYPKAGERNSTVKIGVYNLVEDKTVWIDIHAENDQYIPRINWTEDPNLLAIRRMNRHQDKRELLLANATTGDTEIIKTETSDAWIDVHDDLQFLDNGKQFITTSEESGYNHIYLYNIEGELVRQVTHGDWEVTNYLGYKRAENRIYYVSTQNSPLERHLYSIKLDGSDKKKLTTTPGWHSINMSNDLKYYIDDYSAPGKPPQYTLHNNDGEELRILEDNKELQDTMKTYALPSKEFI